MSNQQYSDRLAQAYREELTREQAIAFSSRLLQELETYLQRRSRRGYHSDFDDLFETLMPGLALAIHLLNAQEAQEPNEHELQEQWGAMLPSTLQLLRELVATFGLPYTRHLVSALLQEGKRAQANEQLELVYNLMEWGAEHNYPLLRTDKFEIPQGLDSWSAFCGTAAIEHLQAAVATIQLRQQAEAGRKRLAQLSAEKHVPPALR